jgi:acetyl-CoA synthetase
MTFDLTAFTSYEEAAAQFRLDMPELFNAAQIFGQHELLDRPALHCVGDAPHVETLSFRDLAQAVPRVGSALRELGMGSGSRICVSLPSTPEAAIAIFAAIHIGAVAVGVRSDDLGIAFQQLALVDPDLLICEATNARTLTDSTSCRVLTADRGDWDLWVRGDADKQAKGEMSLATLLAIGDPDDPPAETRSTDAAFITFTSGSTGAMKAVVLGHTSFLAAVPAFQMYTNLSPKDGDVFFTSLGWTTGGGLRTSAFPAWYFGAPVVAAGRRGIDRSTADVISALGVTVAIVLPQVLREFRASAVEIARYDWTSLRTIAFAGESISSDLHRWLEDTLNVVINPYYGATETAYVASACSTWFESAPGSVGRVVPGRRITTIDETTGEETGPAQPGVLAVRRSDPGLALGLASGHGVVPFGSDSLTDDLFITGDIGKISGDGSLTYLGRSGQLVATVTGEHLAPQAVDDIILGIAGVREAAAIQTNDDEQGTVTICVSLAPDADPDAVTHAVASGMTDRFHESLAARRVVLFDELPKLPTTGKIDRRRAAELLAAAPAATRILI